MNYTVATDMSQNDEMQNPKTVLKFFKEFNLLVAEILSDITDYLKKVSQASPTRANIERLKQAVRTLSSLKRSRRVGMSYFSVIFSAFIVFQND
jgi:chromosome condensin MukBEF MukE localization factor